MEARIQRRTWPAVGCADLFVAALIGGNGRPTGRLLGLHGPWRNESVLESRAKSPLLVGCRSCAVSQSHHPPKPVRAPDSPASPSGTTPNLRRENAPPVVETLSPWHSSWDVIASESDISHERLAHPPLEARASVDRGVSVVVTESHGNRAASSGWMMRLVEQSRFAAIP